MNIFFKVLLVVLVILIIILAVLYYFGRKLERKQAEQQAMMKAAEQVVSMLVIDKKKLKMKESGLPKMVIDQTPKYMSWAKVPVVKAKVGPKIMTLIADEKVFPLLPVKAEVKAVVSGIYITQIKSVRGGKLETPPVKKGLFGRFQKSKSEKEAAKKESGKKSSGKKNA
ncbi:MAG: hypothetical protein HFG49_10490 [Lachnospiraceae bacterium]|nr:hypothetical protein [Lachnospiraceae bacterium]